MARPRLNVRSVDRCSRRILALLVATIFCAVASPAAEIVVTDNGDDGIGGCQLRDAIIAANSDAISGGCSEGDGSDRIVFSGVSYIVLESDLPTILEDLEIAGPGPENLVIDGDDQNAVFYVDAGLTVQIRGLTVYQGEIDGNVRPACIGALAGADLTLEDVRVESCTATGPAGRVVYLDQVSSLLTRFEFVNNRGDDGGVKILGGSSTIQDSSFFENQIGTPLVVGNAGGGASVIVERSTFTDNVMPQTTAIHLISNTASLTLRHSTIASNDKTAGGAGGALYVLGTATMTNTILAGNDYLAASLNNPDLYVGGVGSITTGGFNLVGDNSGEELVFPAGQPNVNDDWVGTGVAPLAPGLGARADNGGPTETLLPEAASPSVDHGSCGTETEDQRGFGNPSTALRSVGSACDIGAVERGATERPLFADGFESGSTSEWS